MNKHTQFRLKRVALTLAIAIPIVTFPLWYLRLFPQPELRCVDVRDGEVVKLYNKDCQQPGPVQRGSTVIKVIEWEMPSRSPSLVVHLYQQAIL